MTSITRAFCNALRRRSSIPAGGSWYSVWPGFVSRAPSDGLSLSKPRSQVHLRRCIISPEVDNSRIRAAVRPPSLPPFPPSDLLPSRKTIQLSTANSSETSRRPTYSYKRATRSPDRSSRLIRADGYAKLLLTLLRVPIIPLQSIYVIP